MRSSRVVRAAEADTQSQSLNSPLLEFLNNLWGLRTE